MLLRDGSGLHEPLAVVGARLCQRYGMGGHKEFSRRKMSPSSGATDSTCEDQKQLQRKEYMAKAITERLIRKHFGPDVTIRRRLFGRWHFTNGITGLRGHLSRRGGEREAPGRDIEVAMYRPSMRLAHELWGETEIRDRDLEIAAEVWREQTL
jgi:hypothetical protein